MMMSTKCCSSGVENEPEIPELAKWSQLRKEWRKSQGSIQIKMPESSIKVKEEEIIIELLDQSRSRQLVAEMMILAGEVAGKYGQEHNIPLPFRGQPRPGYQKKSYYNCLQDRYVFAP